MFSGFFFRNDKTMVHVGSKNVIEATPNSKGSRSYSIGSLYDIVEGDPATNQRFFNTVTVEIMRVTTQNQAAASPNRVSLGSFEFDATYWHSSSKAYQETWGCDTLIAEHPECTVSLQADDRGMVTLSIQGSNSYYWYVNIFASRKPRQ